ncbi:MAG: hypothetical protein LBI48_13140 [Burkholderiaceae bacterium]|jgi:hypothetical protein|nr:hypothetical protein [Burkholderiaceae bacterium]
MNTPTTELTLAQPQRPFDLSPQNFEQALTFSKYLAESDLVPKDFKGRPGNCLVAMQWGMEIGLKPLQALQNIAVINNRPALWGDSVIALVRGSPLCEYVIETDDGATATCRVKRRGEAEQVRTFGMDDARAAGLVGKQGPWTQYPKRMRQMRARAFALRDVFPDVLRGLPVAEEVMDTPAERFMGAVEQVPAAQLAAPKQYSAEEFDKNFPKWSALIAEGKKTAAAIIQFVAAKGTPLSEEQKARLLSVKPAATGAPADAAKASAQSAPAVAPAPAPAAYGQLAERISAAQSQQDLPDIAELIDAATTDERQRAELTAAFDLLPPF